MNRLLIVKVTSLGDIVHGQPIVADIHRAFPGITIDWAADESCAHVLRWNPGIDRALSAPLRRFKKQRGGTDFKTIAASISSLREQRYDLVLDCQGVYKSAIIAFLARSRIRYGYRSRDLGERGAAFAYTRRFGPRPKKNAWEGLRETVADALGYTLSTPPAFNLRVPPASVVPDFAAQAPFAMLFHATSADVKKWPCEHWQTLGRHLSSQGVRCVLPWGSDSEREEAVRIAAGIPNAHILPRLSVEEVAQHIDLATLIVGTDTGFVHLASALHKPTVMIFAATSRDHYGVSVPGLSVSVGDEGTPPTVAEVQSAVEAVWPLHQVVPA